MLQGVKYPQIEVNGKASEWLWDGFPKMKVQIPREMLIEIFAYVDEVSGEISGLGDVEVEGEVLKITRLRMFKQECTGSETTIKPEHLEELTVACAAGNEDASKIRFWWHSHAGMQTFWSKTDDECVQSLLGCFQNYVLSIVVNKKRDLLARVDYMCEALGRKVQITHHRLEVEVTEEAPAALKERVTATVKEFVTAPTYKAPVHQNNSSGLSGERHFHRQHHQSTVRDKEPYKSGRMIPRWGYIHDVSGDLYHWKSGVYLPHAKSEDQAEALETLEKIHAHELRHKQHLEGLDQKKTAELLVIPVTAERK